MPAPVEPPMAKKNYIFAFQPQNFLGMLTTLTWRMSFFCRFILGTELELASLFLIQLRYSCNKK